MANQIIRAVGNGLQDAPQRIANLIPGAATEAASIASNKLKEATEAASISITI